ncbi:hypothetical protein AVEN_135011-1 [Araneus ventricosus]|uniref:Uncharacterized protein n=1 Tax=Araneus ventricosus TaxID=182803 RepID=A0A4Y2G788_ARAVE|nr:hypothetical protein AVEN_135011-1 [Araneus ventricosus]
MCRITLILKSNAYFTSLKNKEEYVSLYVKVSQHSAAWNREITIFMTEHGPFPQNLKRFKLFNTDNCNCGAVGTPTHYATSVPSPSHGTCHHQTKRTHWSGETHHSQQGIRTENQHHHRIHASKQ